MHSFLESFRPASWSLLLLICLWRINFLSLLQHNFLCLIAAMCEFHLVKIEKKKMMNLLEFNLYETLHVKVYQ